jgi:hypothetical protein
MLTPCFFPVWPHWIIKSFLFASLPLMSLIGLLR